MSRDIRKVKWRMRRVASAHRYAFTFFLRSMWARKSRHAQNVQVINERMQISETGTPLYTRARRQTDRRVRVVGTGVSRGRVHLHAGYRQWNLSLARMECGNVTVVRWANVLWATLMQENHVDESSPPHQRKCANAAARRLWRLWCVTNVECRRLRHLVLKWKCSDLKCIQKPGVGLV